MLERLELWNNFHIATSEALDTPKLHPTPVTCVPACAHTHTHTHTLQPLPGNTIRECKESWLQAVRITTQLYSSQLRQISISQCEPSGEKPRKENRSGKNGISFCQNSALGRSSELSTWADHYLHPPSELLWKPGQRNATVQGPH